MQEFTYINMSSTQDNPNQDASATRERSSPGRVLRRSKRHKKGSHDDADLEAEASESGTEQQPDPDAERSDFAFVATDDEADDDDEDSEDSEEEEEEPKKDPRAPNTEMRAKFRKYCRHQKRDIQPMTKETATSIRLVDTLRKKKAPLNAYEEVMEWHLRETLPWFNEEHTLQHTPDYFTRPTLMKRVAKRYNVGPLFPKSETVRLPFSKSKVNIPYTDAADCIVSLLTDPRIDDDNYSFYDDDPLAPPPLSVPYLEDLHTGDAYLKSYEKFITKKNQVLLPVVVYIDAAVTGQFSALPITAVKIGLGILDRKTRDKGWAWRELGYIPQVRKERSRGRKIYQESQHMEAEDMVVMDGEGDTADEDSEKETYSDDSGEESDIKAQDFHTMLRHILKSFVDLQRTGFIWDLVYKGTVYKNVEFVIFVPFVKCDTEEADALCGKYQTRTKGIKHCCWYCHCPMCEADNPMARYPMKKQAKIKRLCDKKDLERLKAISQHCLRNCWYKVRFHAANEMGIHGACPSEMLHAIHLGVFKYLRDIFFDNLGETSQLADNINGLARTYGVLFTRQSDRDVESPRQTSPMGSEKGS